MLASSRFGRAASHTWWLHNHGLGTNSEAATNAILYGSCDAQPVQVTIGVQGGWIQATIRDQGRPPSRTAPLMSLRGRGLWLIGQLVDKLRLAKARPGMLVPLRQCISLGDSAGSASCAMVG